MGEGVAVGEGNSGAPGEALYSLLQAHVYLSMLNRKMLSVIIVVCLLHVKKSHSHPKNVPGNHS